MPLWLGGFKMRKADVRQNTLDSLVLCHSLIVGLAYTKAFVLLDEISTATLIFSLDGALVVRLHVFDRFQNQVQPFDFHVSVGQTCQNKVVAPLGSALPGRLDILASTSRAWRASGTSFAPYPVWRRASGTSDTAKPWPLGHGMPGLWICLKAVTEQK